MTARLIIAAAIVLGLCCGFLSPGSSSENASALERHMSVAGSWEFSAQTRQERSRPRLRIQREQPAAWPYPRPDDYSWPGPGAVRQCVDWYATEYRPSGTVITPQMRCRWVRG